MDVADGELQINMQAVLNRNASNLSFVGDRDEGKAGAEAVGISSDPGLPPTPETTKKRLKGRCLKKKDNNKERVENPTLLECPECSFRTPHRSSMLVHSRVHSGEKPFVCPVCRKGFSQPAGLLIHKRVHTGERPYKCKICNYAASQPANYNLHKRRHSEVKDFKCSVCQFWGSRKDVVERHEKECHNDGAYVGMPSLTKPVSPRRRGTVRNGSGSTKSKVLKVALKRKGVQPNGGKKKRKMSDSSPVTREPSPKKERPEQLLEPYESNAIKFEYEPFPKITAADLPSAAAFDPWQCVKAPPIFETTSSPPALTAEAPVLEETKPSPMKYFISKPEIEPELEQALSKILSNKTPSPKKAAAEVNANSSKKMGQPSTMLKKDTRCSICRREFMNRCALEKHTRTVHNDSRPYKCKTCNYTCKYESQFDLHKRRHVRVDRFKCSICRYWSPSQHYILQHETLYHDNQEARTQDGSDDGVVSEPEPTREKTKRTTSSRTATKDSTASRRNSLRDPQDAPSKELKSEVDHRPFKCDICDYAGPQSFCLVQHMRGHEAENTYKCSVCPYWSSKPFFIKRHEQECHLGGGAYVGRPLWRPESKGRQSLAKRGGLRRKISKTPAPSRTSASRREYQSRRRSEEQVEEGPVFLCPQCPFRAGMTFHADLQKYKCTMCRYWSDGNDCISPNSPVRTPKRTPPLPKPTGNIGALARFKLMMMQKYSENSLDLQPTDHSDPHSSIERRNDQGENAPEEGPSKRLSVDSHPGHKYSDLGSASNGILANTLRLEDVTIETIHPYSNPSGNRKYGGKKTKSDSNMLVGKSKSRRKDGLPRKKIMKASGLKKSLKESVKLKIADLVPKTVMVNGTELYVCSVCGIRVKHRGNLLTHYRVHTGAHPYKCDLCNFDCKYWATFRNHKKCHKEVADYKCSMCSFWNTLSKRIEEHERTCHGPRLDFQTPTIEASSEVEQKWVTAMYTTGLQGKQNSPLEASKGGYASSASVLKQDGGFKETLPQDSLNNSKEEASKSLSEESRPKLPRPLKRKPKGNKISAGVDGPKKKKGQTGIKATEGDGSGASGKLLNGRKKLKYELNIQTVVVDGTKIFICPDCGKQAKHRHHIIFHHKRVHLGEMGHKCNICDFTCKYRSSFLHHRKYHYNMTDFKCPHCPFWHNSEKRLQLHQDTCHSTSRMDSRTTPAAEPSPANKEELVPTAAPDELEQAFGSSFRDVPSQLLDKKSLSSGGDEAGKNSNHQGSAAVKEEDTRRERPKSNIRKQLANRGKRKLRRKGNNGQENPKKKLPFKRRRPLGRRWNCPTCGLSFKAYNQMLVHKKIHAARQVFKCNSCEYVGRHLASFELHQLNHTVVKEFKCSICPYWSSLPRYVVRHQRAYHTRGLTSSSASVIKIKTEPEVGGGRYFLSPPSSAVAIKLEPGSEPEGTLEIPEDSASRSQRGSVDRSPECSTEGRDWWLEDLSKESRERQSIGFAGPSGKPFAGEDYTNGGEASAPGKQDKNPTSIHKDEIQRKVRSEKRGRKGKKLSKSELSTAVNSGHGCADCGSVFRLRAHYVVHRRIHTGERPYKCDICSFASAQWVSLRNHKKYHTVMRDFKCSICPYWSAFPKYVELHERNCHSEAAPSSNSSQRKDHKAMQRVSVVISGAANLRRQASPAETFGTTKTELDLTDLDNRPLEVQGPFPVSGQSETEALGKVVNDLSLQSGNPNTTPENVKHPEGTCSKATEKLVVTLKSSDAALGSPYLVSSEDKSPSSCLLPQLEDPKSHPQHLQLESLNSEGLENRDDLPRQSLNLPLISSFISRTESPDLSAPSLISDGPIPQPELVGRVLEVLQSFDAGNLKPSPESSNVQEPELKSELLEIVNLDIGGPDPLETQNLQSKCIEPVPENLPFPANNSSSSSQDLNSLLQSPSPPMEDPNLKTEAQSHPSSGTLNYLQLAGTPNLLNNSNEIATDFMSPSPPSSDGLPLFKLPGNSL